MFILRQVQKRAMWIRCTKKLNKMSTMTEFQEYVKLKKPKDFLFYQNGSLGKRKEFQRVAAKLALAVEGRSVLEIGPGYGDTLDMCHESKAKDIHFIEYDPFFYTYNRLKGFTKGYHMNHLWKLRVLDSYKYDLIWSRGSVVADFFESYCWLISAEKWIQQVDRIASPGCKVVICPYWVCRSGKRVIENVHQSKLTKALMSHDYIILDKIEKHNSEPAYPITFFKEFVRLT